MVAQPEENNGPDRIIPSDAIMTWDADEAVKIKIDAKGPGAEKPISIMTMVKETVDKFPNHTAYAVKEDDQWVKYTYQQYYNSIKQVARAFIKLGLEPNHGVGIIGFNSPEWFISDLASIFAGGFATGIYTTNSPEACQYVADNARCNVVVVENDQQLQKFLQVRNQLPHLKAIVQYKGKVKENYQDVFTWEQLLSMGSEDLESALQQRIESQAPNKCCALIYTSGTTGNPKGVMLSHDNLVWSGKMLIARVNGCETDAVISYLPLSHIAAQLLDIYGPFSCGASVYFAQPDALKGSLGKTLKEVQPTVFMGVPRVWEKMQEAMVAVGKGSGLIKRSIASWAKDVGLKGSLATMNGESKPFFFGLANKLVFEKVRTALGLERCRLCLTGAAPIMRDTLEFFYSLNIPLMEVYGMSECTGAHTLGMSDSYYIGSVGKEFPGVSTLLANQDDEGNGEICMGGRHVFMGYLNNEEKTRECIDGDRWLHSGDVGKKDKNGFMYITGRIKELIITAGGENIPPVLIEDKVRERLPCISNCMLIGDKRKFLSILLTLKSEIDADTLVPKDKLAPAAVQWCRSVGSDATTVTEVVKKTDAAVLKAIQDGINAVNKSATSRAQCIQKWTILPCDFSVPGGELGPTLKLKRPVVHSMYSATIEAFYSDSGTD